MDSTLLTFLAAHWLDMLTTALGLAYILLEYRASIWLWAVGFAMQSLGIVLYYQKGLYADCGMEFYYLAMTVYGFLNWTRGAKTTQSPAVQASSAQVTEAQSPAVQASSAPASEAQLLPVTHFPLRLAALWTIATLVIWAALYLFLVTCTDSRVPIADSFTTALSFVGIWALARKYLEQWLIWIVVDIVTCILYFYKDIPFKASLYALYIVIAVFGYRKWRMQMYNPG
ncbi:MAG: nicotinamide mononucleotide transporter [Bacteroidaceae bacterium]|nr:nicotinamide mononucleotide transporter [Bacteroidaceae bacterium]